MQRLFLIFVLSFSVSFVYSQFDFIERPVQQPRNEFNVFLVPHYILYNGLRIDFERVKASKAWVFAPQFYYLKRSSHPLSYSDVALNTVLGTGIGFYRKFVKSSTANFLGYWALGGSINYFGLGYKQYTWVARQFYDQTVYDYELVSSRGSLLRFEFSATIGIETKLWNFLIFEPYLGSGYRYTIPFLPETTNPFDTYFSIGYTGPIFVLGFKFGIGKSFIKNQL